jgi:hypothetical protein
MGQIQTNLRTDLPKMISSKHNKLIQRALFILQPIRSYLEIKNSCQPISKNSEISNAIKKIQVQFEEKLLGEFFLKYTAKVQLRELKSFYQNAKKKSETEIKLDFILYCSNLQFDC